MIHEALNRFQIETSSWGFADTGTRSGKFLQDASSIDINNKLADTGQVHAFTGFCPHLLWDFKPGQPVSEVMCAVRTSVTLMGQDTGLWRPSVFTKR